MNSSEFWVGSYASAEQKSIYRCTVDFGRGVLTCEESCSGISNPTYLLYNKNSGVLYAVEECMPEGSVCAFDIRKGAFEKKAALACGAAPCHLSLDDSERFLFAANYMSGDLAMFFLDAQGIPVRMTDKRQHLGKGIDPDRQDGPHVHFSAMKDGVLYVTDLGLDTISRFTIDADSKTLKSDGDDIHLPPGSGPRHLCFHPEKQGIMYVICELSAQIAVIKNDGDGCSIVQTISILPDGYTGRKHAAAMKLSENGRFLFASERANHSITAFKVLDNGTLEVWDIKNTGGSMPRDFALVDDYIIAANQESGDITVLQFDSKTGKISKTGMRYTIMNPVCIALI